MQIFVRDKNFYRNVAVIAVPIAMQSLITIGVNMMDTIMLGALGETPLSASSLANQFINIYHIFCMGLSMGASVLTARFWGMNDRHSLRKAVTIMFRLCILMGLGFTVATLLAPGGIMRIYTNEEHIIADGVKYLTWSVPCYLLLGMSLTTTIVMRSVSLVKIPLFTSIGAFFINVFCNYIFIFGKFGAPRMEVAGAALGTLISRTFEFCVICGYFFFVDKRVGYRIKHLFMSCKDLVGDYIRLSIPVLISDGIMALGNNAVAMVMGRIGSSFVSANAITAVTQQLSTVFIQGISQASAMITGQTLGKGEYKKAQQQGYSFFGMGVILGLVAGGFIMLVSGPVINSYNITQETKEIAQQLMAAISVIVFFQSANSILTKGVLRGGGDTKFLMVADVLFLWVASVPLGILAGLIWHLPAFWIYTCLKIDQIIKAVWCVFRLRSGKWVKRIESSGKA